MKGTGANQKQKAVSRDNHGKYIADKVWFSCQIVQYGKIFIFIFSSFLLVSGAFWVWGEGWPLGYNPMKFWDFPDLSWFLKILNLKSWGKSSDSWYIPYFLLIITLRFTCGEKKKENFVKYQKVSKYYVHDCTHRWGVKGSVGTSKETEYPCNLIKQVHILTHIVTKLIYPLFYTIYNLIIHDQTILHYHSTRLFWPVSFEPEFSHRVCTWKQEVVGVFILGSSKFSTIKFSENTKQTQLWKHLWPFCQFRGNK